MQLFADLKGSDGLPTLRVRAEQVRAVYQAQPLSLVTVLVNSCILVLTLWQVIPGQALVIWSVLTIGVVVLRLVAYRAFLAVEPGDERVVRWAWPMLSASVLSGLLWGSAAIWLWPESQPLHQALVVTMTAGMTVGAISTMAPLLPSALSFIHLALWPIAGRFLFMPPEIATSLLAFILLFILMLSVTAVRLNHAVVTNLTARFQREQAEARVQQQALYDALTELPNRRFLLDRLAQEFSRATRHGYSGAVLFLDLDNFKNINDSLGHQVGDELLQQVAERLRTRMRVEDVAARLGGDEFVVLLPDLDADDARAVGEAQQVAGELRLILGDQYEVAGHELHVTVSIGIAVFPGDAVTPQDVLKHADTAMYRAKADGRNAAQVFLPSMQEAAVRRLTVEKELRRGLLEQQMTVHYQPQVDLDGAVIGLEGLVRWQHPERGLVLPSEFIDVAEETGLMFDLHDWLLDQVCEDINELRRACRSKQCPVVSINVSAREFRRPGFAQRIQAALSESGVPPSYLRIEITESLAMEQVQHVIAKMKALREFGVTFAIDDFGTGYSSLAYLKQLPVDALKIDRSFVSDVPEDLNDAKIVEAIIAMASHFGIEPVAEGVERQQTLDYLQEVGCTKFQGWLFGKPEPLQRLLERIVA